MTAMNNERNPHVITFPVGAAGTFPFIWCPRKFKILAVRIINGAGLAQDATNFVTVQIRRGNEIIASYASATDGGFTANVARTAAILDPTILAGTQLTVVTTLGGTGAFTSGLLQVEGFFV